ncbi:hypothetical protein OR16_34823 [Cupriavidus basilensis OR16]|uniref:Lipoprotein n=1 Tax=Cupriavidus basilensis OR16 TaxID=1127483 RepID=H1SF61_9BURK|nr:hypothetical protein [Cupriavidus basilensis]EHP38886.1 hypothetical protein OR16_34823 [Cupriavidus basilensis OR16]
MKRLIGAAGIALALAGCGGSGDNDGGLAIVRTPPAATSTTPTTPTAPTTPVIPAAPDTIALGSGFYIGTSATNERFNILVLDENVYYAFYAMPGIPDVSRGVLTGNYSSGSGALTTNNNGLDFNQEAAGYSLTAANLLAAYVPGKSIQAQVTYRNGRSTVVNATYSTDYNFIATTDGLKGTYNGTSNVIDTSGITAGGVRLVVDASGNFTLDGSGSGCSFTGTATPRRQGKVYNVVLQLSGPTCLYANTPMSGIAYYDPTTTHSLPAPGQLYLFAMRPDRQVGVIFTGKL